ncbi:MAG TPA: histidine phosphatase family protein [Rhizomicrobium sp.]|jgi:probable phosphoglycerate mutase|nr:histidine phosphatase family protein [Rhizomicrobium sp.]
MATSLQSLTLYVIRHGQTEDNVIHRSTGHNDSALTAQGLQQAAANGRLLKEVAGPLGDFSFFASSLHRACVTMEIVRTQLGLPPTQYSRDRRLMECDFGRWTGRKEDEVAAHEPDAIAAREADKWNYQIPGGESQKQLHARVGDFLGELTDNAVLVCHAGSVRMIRSHYLGLGPDDTVYYTPDNSGILRLSGGCETHFGD